MPALWRREIGDNADRGVPSFLYMRRLRRDPAAKGGRLLRILLLRFRALSADPGGAFWREGRRLVLPGEFGIIERTQEKFLPR